VWFLGFPLSTILCNSRSENQKVSTIYLYYNYYYARSRCGAEYAVSRQKVRFKAHLLALLTHKTCSQPLLAERLFRSEKSALARPTSINFVALVLVAACTHSALEHTSRLYMNLWSTLHEHLSRFFYKRMAHIVRTLFETQFNSPLRHESASDPHEGAS
jgi:hypothetical protein